MTAWRIVLAVVAVAAATMDAPGAIRVYEGANLPPAPREPRPEHGRPTTNGNAYGRRQQPDPLRVAESRVDDVARTVSEDQLKYFKDLKTNPELYKVKLSQRGYLQFLRYLADVPPLREYTFCLWFKSNDFSHKQTLFSYAVLDKERLLTFWYEAQDATFRMAVRDDLAIKIPGRLVKGTWHHICQSWNGVSGEWKIYLDGNNIGFGQLHKYTGTYIPGGGEVVVGQEPADFHNGLDVGVEGEVFGFNMVDEFVKDEVIFVKPRHPPVPAPQAVDPEPTQYVPPFKSLPPMKKNYQEIKAFITSLPSKPAEYGTRNRPKVAPVPGRPPLKPPLKGKPQPQKDRPRPVRNKPRIRYKPVIRKMVIYDRDGRQMQLNGTDVTKKIGEAPANVITNQVYDEKYSVHTYRAPAGKHRLENKYEIYEMMDEGEAGKALTSRGRLAGQRKVRQNFNIYTARKGNSLYAKATRLRQYTTPKFHYQRVEPKTLVINRRSDSAPRKPVMDDKNSLSPLDFIPVYELVDEDGPNSRRKRETGPVSVDDLTANFQPLPEIPDGFIKLFSESKTRNEMDQKLDHYFPNSTSDAARDSPQKMDPSLDPITERLNNATENLSMRNDVVDESSRRSSRRNMIVSVKDLERRPGITSGTELVRRSFEDCGADRGSPVSDKDRFVVSWSDTPVRIYGGAVVTLANNVCGHF